MPFKVHPKLSYPLSSKPYIYIISLFMLFFKETTLVKKAYTTHRKMAKLCLASLLLSVIVVSVAFAKKDPELKQCKHQCKQQQGFDDQQKQRCERECDDYIRQKKEQEKQEKGRGEHGGQGWENYYSTEERHQEQQPQQENPYVFEEKHFETYVKTEEGRILVLPKFTDRSQLLQGIENYRLGFLEANPRAFLSPAHFDADCVFLVVQGRATATTVKEDKRESTNLKPGDIFKVPAGTPVYLINRDENERLYIVRLLRPISLPGHFETFYGPGGEDPESFYPVFSWELLEAAFKTDRNKLERLFRQQKRGTIIKASREHVQEMTKHAEGGSVIWPFGGETAGSFNIFRKSPSQANQYGQLREVNSKDYPELQDLNLIVSFANISRGAMSGPAYNSRATKISFVVDGEGYFEMACPHFSSAGSSSSEEQYEQGSSTRQKSSPKYLRVSGKLRRGTVFIVPAGHPVSLVASQSNNLQVVCFEVNAKGNIRYTLAGKSNVVKRMEGIAKELAFNVSRSEVDRIFGNQDEDLFYPGPGQQQEDQGGRGRAYA